MWRGGLASRGNRSGMDWGIVVVNPAWILPRTKYIQMVNS